MKRSMIAVLSLVAVVAVMLAAGAAQAVVIVTVPVGDVGNAADTSAHSGNPAGQGTVGYTYNIGKYEVTAGQYTALLNAVAATDTYGLYNAKMASDIFGCKIMRSGIAGNYTYSVADDRANRPVNFVSWGDAARFANWLTNGQPTGAQTISTTEDGSYYLNGATSQATLTAVTRKTNWKWAIPTEDEWYKAAFYKGGGTDAGYWDHATSSVATPGRDMTEATNAGNNANYYPGSGAYPIDGDGKYTTVVGEFQDSDSPYGTFDQGGNVYEWNEAFPVPGWGGLRGGSFGYTDPVLDASHRYQYQRQNDLASSGFRVVVPEPATLALLALGGIGMLLRRRRNK